MRLSFFSHLTLADACCRAPWGNCQRAVAQYLWHSFALHFAESERCSTQATKRISDFIFLSWKLKLAAVVRLQLLTGPLKIIVRHGSAFLPHVSKHEWNLCLTACLFQFFIFRFADFRFMFSHAFPWAVLLTRFVRFCFFLGFFLLFFCLWKLLQMLWKTISADKCVSWH